LRKRLEEKIYAQGYSYAKTAPIVSLEDFFEENKDDSSIGCNLMKHPGVKTFYDVLMNVRKQDSVQEVFVEIMELEDDEEYWAFSERIYVLTSVEESVLRK
jgi:hypothetical protein